MTPEKLCQDLGTYYDKPLTTTQAKPIIKHIDHYPVEKLRELFNLIVTTCGFMPKLSRIIELADQLGTSTKVGCPKCSFTGFIDVKLSRAHFLSSGSESVYPVVTMCECHPGK